MQASRPTSRAPTELCPAVCMQDGCHTSQPYGVAPCPYRAITTMAGCPKKRAGGKRDGEERRFVPLPGASSVPDIGDRQRHIQTSLADRARRRDPTEGEVPVTTIESGVVGDFDIDLLLLNPQAFLCPARPRTCWGGHADDAHWLLQGEHLRQDSSVLIFPLYYSQNGGGVTAKVAAAVCVCVLPQSHPPNDLPTSAPPDDNDSRREEEERKRQEALSLSSTAPRQAPCKTQGHATCPRPLQGCCNLPRPANRQPVDRRAGKGSARGNLGEHFSARLATPPASSLHNLPHRFTLPASSAAAPPHPAPPQSGSSSALALWRGGSQPQPHGAFRSPPRTQSRPDSSFSRHAAVPACISACLRCQTSSNPSRGRRENSPTSIQISAEKKRDRRADRQKREMR